ERPMIFHTCRALDAATNINGVRHDCGDRASYILHVQTAGENQESGERQCRSRGKPIACLAGTTAEIGVICIDEHITIGEPRGVFWLESRISLKYSSDSNFAGQFAARFRRCFSL